MSICRPVMNGCRMSWTKVDSMAKLLPAAARSETVNDRESPGISTQRRVATPIAGSYAESHAKAAVFAAVMK